MRRVHLPKRQYASVSLLHPDTDEEIGVCQSQEGIWYLLLHREIRTPELLCAEKMLWIQTGKKDERIMLAIQQEQAGYAQFTKWYPPSSGIVTIGRLDSCDIICENSLISGIHGRLIWDKGIWRYEDMGSTNGSWLNGRRVRTATLQFGDVLCFIDRVLTVGYGFFSVNQGDVHGLEKKNVSRILSSEIFMAPKRQEFQSKIVWISMWKGRERVLEKPPQSNTLSGQSGSLAQTSSVLIGIAALSSGLVSFYGGIQQNMAWTNLLPSALMSISIAMSMIVFPLYHQKKQKRQWERQEKERMECYRNYLKAQESQWRQVHIREENWLKNMFPMQLEQILQEKKEVWSRHFASQEDVCVPLGLGRVEFLPMDKTETLLSWEEDILFQEYQTLRKKSFYLENVPVLLKKKVYPTVQFCGEESEILSYCKNLLLWMATLTFPKYLKFAFFLDEWSWKKWKEWRWLEHTMQDGQRLFAVGEQEWRRLLQNCAENQSEICYLAIFDCASWNPSLDGLVESISGIWSWYLVGEHMIASAHVCVEAGQIGVQMQDGSWREKAWRIKFGDERSILRSLNQLREKSEMKKAVFPSQISFLELFQVQRVEELDVAWRWRKRRDLKSLCVPVGVRQGGEVWNLDLHERCHGPHMLMAGMTGSGKSECLMTILLSLAVCYSPEELIMVIIDYKGGGLAQILANQKMRLPHLSGVLTNLSDSSAQRVLFALANEQKRRQQLFARVGRERADGGMDIDRYQKLCLMEKDLQPIPHLFLVVDEFAELKSSQPEFLEELIRSARIGRSLGIHLILATQKPSGVVNEQIWSNSRTRICLKVQDKSDSMEVLHRPEAASLRQIGRFFVQCGQDEIFEEVQSAWSGESYVPNQIGKKPCQILQVNHRGQVCQQVDLHLGGQVQTQAAAVVEYLQKEALRLQKQAKPLWLPELGQSRSWIELRGQYPSRYSHLIGVLMGECDNPQSQSKHGLWWFLEKDGNLLIAGGSLRERQTLLHGILYQMSRQKKKIEIYRICMDGFRENISKESNEIIISGMDENEMKQFFQSLEQRFIQRKAGSEKCDSLLIVVLDNVVVFQENYERWMFLLCQIAREGMKFRMGMILMSHYLSEVRFRLQQSFQSIVLFWMAERAEFRALTDNNVRIAEQIFGRGIIQKGEVYEFQMAEWDE